jgi:hypothetical protein
MYARADLLLPYEAQPVNSGVGGLRDRSLDVEMEDRFGAAGSFRASRLGLKHMLKAGFNAFGLVVIEPC